MHFISKKTSSFLSILNRVYLEQLNNTKHPSYLVLENFHASFNHILLSLAIKSSMFVSSLSLSDISLTYLAAVSLVSSALDSSTVSMPHSFSDG
jgi:hypothetical protein